MRSIEQRVTVEAIAQTCVPIPKMVEEEVRRRLPIGATQWVAEVEDPLGSPNVQDVAWAPGDAIPPRTRMFRCVRFGPDRQPSP